MNWFDLVLVVLVLVGVIVGYIQGLLRQLTGLLALYIGLVMASYFHEAVERWIDFFAPKMANVAQESLAFLGILAVVYVTLHWLGTVRLAFAQALEASPLVPTFQTYLAFVARTLLPWLPAGLPTFFYLI